MGYKILSLRLVHDDWSTFTEDYVDDSLSCKIISSIPISDKNIIVATAYIFSRRWISVEELINRMKRFNKIREISVLYYKRAKNKNFAISRLEANYNDSITKILLENNTFFYREKMFNGEEYWKLLVDKNHFGKLLESLREVTELKSVYELNSDAVPNLFGLIDLTERQKRVLREALEKGYFNWPKNIRTVDLAKSLGISKVTLVQEIRLSIKKILDKSLESD